MNTRQTTPNILDDVLAAKQETGPVLLPLADVKRDGGMQPRAGVDMAYVAELVEALVSGANLPPVEVTYDGSGYWLWDGYHRFEACAQLGMTQIAARVRQGDQASAQWDSFAANQAHGLRRTNADKERAIRAALRHAQGQQLSNREIGRHLGVDDKTIAKYRDEMTTAQEIPQVTQRQGADGKSYDTAKKITRVSVGILSKLDRAALRPIVERWAAAYWQGEWPENPSHTNGTFWQEITRWMGDEVTELWSASDLKFAIKQVAFARVMNVMNEAQQARQAQQPAATPEPALPTLSRLEIEQLITPVVEAYIADEDQMLACGYMRNDGRQRSGPFWERCLGVMPADKKMDPYQLCWAIATVVGRQERQETDEERAPAEREAAADEAVRMVETAAETVLMLDDLPVVATTGPVPFTVNGGPLPAWVVMEPVIEPTPDEQPKVEQPDRATTNHDLYMRKFQLGIWRRSFQGALDELDGWAEATGHHTATLEAERGLRLMVELTDNELAALAA